MRRGVAQGGQVEIMMNNGLVSSIRDAFPDGQQSSDSSDDEGAWD
jgi:hypothetical protein